MRANQKFVDGQRRTDRRVDPVHRPAGLRTARDIGLVGDDDQKIARLFEPAQRIRRIGEDLQLVHPGRRMRRSVAYRQTVKHSVAIQKDGLRHFTDSHLVSACLSAGCVTSRCQITA